MIKRLSKNGFLLRGEIITGGGRLFCLIREFFLYGEKDILRKYQVLLRKEEYHFNTKHKLRSFIYHLKVNRLGNKYGLHIGVNTCGKGLKIMHLGSVLINDNARVGENCRFHINTALVAGGTNDYAPQLGNNIVIGVGATILGKVRIANGVAIGAGAVVNKDVFEENIAVAGVPAKKISNNGTFSWCKKHG